MKRLFVLLQHIVPQHLLSRIVGGIARARFAPLKNFLIRAFVQLYGVDLGEAVSADPADYETFNAFFTRAMRPDARPVEGAVSSPADGTVSMAGDLADARLIQAKGTTYSAARLLGEQEADAWLGGSFITIYLAPRDYHRVHMPVAGRITRTRYIPGRLFSVNGTTTRQVEDLFVKNERLVLHIDTDHGPVAMVLVGAMIVAGIRTSWRASVYPFGRWHEETFDPPRVLDQGAEVGWFEMGSTVILLTPSRIHWKVGPDSRVRMGQPIA